jgi:hypothetical protein
LAKDLLTSEALSHGSEPRPDFLLDAEDIEDELSKAGKFFFSPEVKRLPVDISSSLITQHLKPIWKYDEETLNRLNPVLRQVVSSIQNSRYTAAFQRLGLEKHPKGYQSPSEADMAFAGYVARALLLLDKLLSREDQLRIIYMAFAYRFERTKLQRRTAYITATASEALDNARLYARSKKCTHKSIVDTDTINEGHQVPKSSAIKVCNIMNIFHFGRPVENHTYGHDKSGNELIVKLPQTLNQTDFKYFMGLLFRYIDTVKSFNDLSRAQMKEKFFYVNMNALFKSIGVASGGHNRKQLFASLDRLSEVHLKYNKIIDREKEFFVKSRGSLTTYQHEKRESKNSKGINNYLLIRMHPAIIDMALDAKYNYALLNKNSYYAIKSDKAKLLYYHFCLSTCQAAILSLFLSRNYCHCGLHQLRQGK